MSILQEYMEPCYRVTCDCCLVEMTAPTKDELETSMVEDGWARVEASGTTMLACGGCAETRAPGE